MSDLFERAKRVMPGGVNSPVRSFKAVGIDPLFIDKADGSRIWDTNGNSYIDYVCSWGPMILGHNNSEIRKRVQTAVEKGLSYGAPTQIEVETAELVCSMVPGMEMLRMVNSGTEAVMSALRLARAFTGRDKIVKFEGCYHGHSDTMLVKAGSGALTLSTPDSSGVTAKQAKDTLTAVYNDLSSVEALFGANQKEIAAIIVEPVAANMGVVLPQEGFLQGLRKICNANGALLIFDEVITGFRLAPGGAQEFFGVNADIVTLGKIIGGGMPVGAYGGRRELMELVAPLGPMYQAGTLSGNPVAMAAGHAQLSILKQNPQLYTELEQSAKALEAGLLQAVAQHKAPVTLNRAGSLLCPFFTKGGVTGFKQAKQSDTGLYAAFFRKMLSRGINLAPAQFEAMFVSCAHSSEDIEKTISCANECFKEMKTEGFY